MAPRRATGPAASPRHARRLRRLARRCLLHLAGALALALLADCARADIMMPAGPELRADAAEDLFLEVSLNGVATGKILRFTRGAAGLLSSTDNFQQLGLDPALFGAAGQSEVALDAVTGLTYEYDAARQSLALKVDDALRTPLTLNARAIDPPPPAKVTPGAVFNYDLSHQLGARARSAMFHELRLFNEAGVFTTSGTAAVRGEGKPYLRYDSYWYQADAERMTVFQAGDLITSSLSWSRSVRLGGLQWRKNFALRPDLLTFPVASLRGSAALPSALSLYVNGVQQYSASVPSGPFVLNQVAGLNGAGQATLLTEDPLGRTVSTTLPLYVDSRMLAPGLLDYSVELGLPRRDYGSRSFAYGGAPLASGSARYGVDDRLTVEGHVELSALVYNSGAGALVRLGSAGVVSASLAASGGAQRGVQGGLGYQYLGPGVSIDLQTVRASAGYGDAATRAGSATPLLTDRAALTLALPAGQSASVSYVGARTPGSAAARIVALSYSVTLAGDLYASASAFRDLKDGRNRGLSLTVSLALGGQMSAAATASVQNGQASRSVGITRGADIDGGFGWGFQVGRVDHAPYQQGQAQYLGRAGQLSATVQHSAETSAAALDLSGALVWMDGGLGAARQVGAGFAMVATGGVAGVPVIHENRRVGVTDRGGHLLIPNLNPYGNNQIAIDISDLPLDARVPVTTLNVVPAQLSGVLASFPVERYAAATVLVHDGAGAPLAAGLPVRHVESGARTLSGYDGMVFLDHLSEDNHVEIGEGADLCQLRFAYRREAAPSLPVIGPLMCRAVAAGAAP
ncbi:MAG: fimbria/pilus outer membrane usher protein [Pseudomonadota bacterium]